MIEAEGFEVVQPLPQFERLFHAYHYVYVALLAAEAVIRRTGWREFSLYRSSLYSRLASAILRRLDARTDETDPSSTLVLCRRTS